MSPEVSGWLLEYHRGYLDTHIEVPRFVCFFCLFFTFSACTRILTRPWATDGFLKNILSQMIEKPDSITKIITYKPTFKDMYARHRTKCHEEVAINAKIVDYAYAPHRFNSETKVLLRLVLTWDATLATAGQVIVSRGGKSPCLLYTSPSPRDS